VVLVLEWGVSIASLLKDEVVVATEDVNLWKIGASYDI
jgi:hypothetical protein